MNPEAFTHGSSAQRQEWFARGFNTGDINKCDTFASQVAEPQVVIARLPRLWTHNANR